MDTTREPCRITLRGRFRRPGFIIPMILGLAVTSGLVRPGAVRAQQASGERADSAAATMAMPRTDHPEPRPGITADHVLAAERLTEEPDAARVFEMVREIPQVFDGIHCRCGCHLRSLLSCFEGEEAMGGWCRTCQAEAELVHRLHEEGKTLDQIRAAVDAEFGP